jgi:hypothetical protein
VAGGQGLAADVDGVFLPDAERVVAAADETLAAPQYEDRAFELVPRGEGLVVVDQVNGRRRAVVGAGARDRPRVAEAADVVLHHGGVEARARAEERADERADPERGVRADQVLGDTVADREEEPVVVGRRHVPRHVVPYVPGRHDVEDGEAGDGLRVVQRQAVRDAGAAVVADQLELLEAEPAHKAHLVAGHGSLGVRLPGGVRIGFAAVAVAPQVGQDDSMVLGEGRGDIAPHEVVLRVAVQHEHGRTRPRDGAVDADAVDVHVPVLEAGQQRGHDFPSLSS